MTALRDTIVAELLRREGECDSLVSQASGSADIHRLAGGAAAYKHAANIVRERFERDGSTPRPLFNTPAAMIARIVAEHPRCIAMAASLAFTPSRPMVSDAAKAQSNVVKRWMVARMERINEVTMDADSASDLLEGEYGALTLGDISIPVVMVTIVCDGARFMVAIEAVR